MQSHACYFARSSSVLQLSITMLCSTVAAAMVGDGFRLWSNDKEKVCHGFPRSDSDDDNVAAVDLDLGSMRMELGCQILKLLSPNLEEDDAAAVDLEGSHCRSGADIIGHDSPFDSEGVLIVDATGEDKRHHCRWWRCS
ncbi:hypothetical protein ACLOJK_041072 [Asimina triloba]